MRFLPAAVLILFYTYVGEATHNLRSNSKMKGQDSFLSKRVLARGGKKTTTSTTAPSDPTGPTDPPESLPYPTCTKSSGEVLRLMTMEEFIPIHKGGPAAIERNCQKDGTWLFENLQCISMVPDHFEGMLSMCAGYVIGVIKGSDEDPCKTTDPNDGSLHLQADNNWEEPVYEDPDFEDCDVYHNITCEALVNQDLLDLPTETIAYLGSNSDPVTQRRWTSQDVATAQETWEVDFSTNFTEHCYTILHDYVYDLGTRPLDGSAPFYKKHGNGMFPQAILKYCGLDMTLSFDAVDGRDELCVPDHTLGGMNVLSGYLVGVKIDGEHDSCVVGREPPNACEYSVEKGMLWYDDLDEVNNLYPESSDSCYVILQGGVYNLAEFSKYHAGGSSQITGGCGTDVTRTCAL
eukprot:scaffold27298_cov72-Cyclotella_meneghiniana.AAC.3